MASDFVVHYKTFSFLSGFLLNSSANFLNGPFPEKPSAVRASGKNYRVGEERFALD